VPVRADSSGTTVEPQATNTTVIGIASAPRGVGIFVRLENLKAQRANVMSFPARARP
jgi:hypothetical protein